MTETTAQYLVLGINGSTDFCSCCARKNLTAVVWVEHVETKEISHLSYRCARKLLGMKVQDAPRAESLDASYISYLRG